MRTGLVIVENPGDRLDQKADEVVVENLKVVDMVEPVGMVEIGVTENVERNKVEVDRMEVSGVEVDEIKLNEVKMGGVEIDKVRLNGVEVSGVEMESVKVDSVEAAMGKVTERSAVEVVGLKVIKVVDSVKTDWIGGFDLFEENKVLANGGSWN